MITEEHEKYIRFILLLLEVGTDLLREITKNALQRKGQALCQFLNSVEPALQKDEHLTRIQKGTLYPPNPQVASINDCDITLLSHLLLNYLNGFIDNNEKKGVNDIRDFRNNYHAHAVEGKMDCATFKGVWKHLSTIITYAGKGLSSDVQQRHVDRTKRIKKDPLDFTAVAEQIKKLDQSRIIFESIKTCLDDMNRVEEQLVVAVKNVQIVATKTEEEVVNVKTIVQNTGVTVDALKKVAQNTDGAIADVHNDVLEMKRMLYKIKARTENQGRITKVVHTVYGLVYLSADEQETVDYAEAALIEASNNSIAKKEPTDLSHQALQDKVTQVLEDIEDLDVKVVAVEKGSIVLRFECYSIKAILDLIDYFYSSNFQRRLDEIINALENIVGKKICIASAKIDRQSIHWQDIITKMDGMEYEKVVQFKLSCTGVDGLLHALEAFEEGYAANSVNELSKALSESIGKPVTLHTSIDLDQMRSAIQSIQDQLDSKLQESYAKEKYPANEYIQDQDEQTKPHKNSIALVYREKTHMKSDFDTIHACAILSQWNLMIADNDGLSVVNTHTGLVEQTKSLNTMHSDIAVLPGDQVAVTLPWDDMVVILSTNDMSLIRNIPDVYHPSGIAYHQNKLFLVCGRHMCVYIFNLFGALLEIVVCDELSIFRCTKVAVSMDAQNLYISDYKSLIKYSAHGRVIARYSFTESEPKALTLLNDGSLVVSTRIDCIDTIHHISADLRQGYELKLGNALFIGVDPVNNQIYAIYKKVIHVYNMQKQSSQRQSDKKLTSATADEKVSSFKSGLRFPSREADKDVTSLKAGKKLLSNMSNETNEKLASIKTEMKLPSLKTDEELTLFKAGTRFPARETDEESASFKSRTRIHSRRTRSPSLEADKESAFFSFVCQTKESMCQLM